MALNFLGLFKREAAASMSLAVVPYVAVSAAPLPAGAPATSIPASAPAAMYADGVYEATGWYGGQPSSIGVTVRLDRGVIMSVRVTPHATVPTSLDFQRRFAAAVPAAVTGKRIDEVAVGRLAGSSGTPKGFNDALERIKAQAQRNRRQAR